MFIFIILFNMYSISATGLSVWNMYMGEKKKAYATKELTVQQRHSQENGHLFYNGINHTML